MDLVTWIALLGAVLAAGISLPQFLLVVRTKTTHGLSLMAWVIAIGTGLGWLNHGIRLGVVNMIWPNLWSLTVAATVLYFLRRNGRYSRLTALLPGFALAAVLIGMDYVVGSAAFGITMAVPQVFGMLRQALALIRSPQVTGVSIMSWVLQVINQVVWMTWAYLIHESGTLICASASLVSAAFVLTWRILRACGLGPIPLGQRANVPVEPV